MKADQGAMADLSGASEGVPMVGDDLLEDGEVAELGTARKVLAQGGGLETNGVLDGVCFRPVFEQGSRVVIALDDVGSEGG